MMLSLSMLFYGCASFKSHFWGEREINIPDITLPADVKKPDIKSEVKQIDGKFYIAYTASDGMKLYKFLVEQEAYIDKCVYRIKIQNELLKKLGK